MDGHFDALRIRRRRVAPTVAEWNPAHIGRRHSTPSAPWPWADIGDRLPFSRINSLGTAPTMASLCPHKGCACWMSYPQSHSRAWSAREVEKSGLGYAIGPDRDKTRRTCTIFRCDVGTNGYSADYGSVLAKPGQEADTWMTIIDDTDLKKRSSNICVRALLVQNMSGPVLQMLGARLNIDPVFFSSSLNWIPSRYQHILPEYMGDHLAIILPFIRPIAIELHQYLPSAPRVLDVPMGRHSYTYHSGAKLIVLDLLSVHLVRNIQGSTLISYHPIDLLCSTSVTSAQHLHEHMHLAGRSVRWQEVFRDCSDPTLILLYLLWYVVYGWDEALECLYERILTLEPGQEGDTLSRILEMTILHTHYIRYHALLEDFRKTVQFIEQAEHVTKAPPGDDDCRKSMALVAEIIAELHAHVNRLEATCTSHMARVANEIQYISELKALLDISTAQRMLKDCRTQQGRDLRQIFTISKIFLPPTFVAVLFKMNVTELRPGALGTVRQYIAMAIPLVILTIWVAVAVTVEPAAPIWRRLAWPFKALHNLFYNADLPARTNYVVIVMPAEKEWSRYLHTTGEKLGLAKVVMMHRGLLLDPHLVLEVLQQWHDSARLESLGKDVTGEFPLHRGQMDVGNVNIRVHNPDVKRLNKHKAAPHNVVRRVVAPGARENLKGKYSATKFRIVLRILNMIFTERFWEKVVVFSRFPVLLGRLEKYLKKHKVGSVKYTPNITDQQRKQALRAISKDSRVKVMLVQITVVPEVADESGIQVNFTACNNVIVLDPLWNFDVEERAIARVHCLGQRRPVNVYRIIAPDTMEHPVPTMKRVKRRRRRKEDEDEDEEEPLNYDIALGLV